MNGPVTEHTGRNAASLCAVATAALLAVSGCSGGTARPAPSSAGASPSASGWRSGEFTTDRTVCTAISTSTRRKLGVGDPVGSETGCYAYGHADVNIDRRLFVDVARYTPPPSRPDSSATDKARHALRRPADWAKKGFGTGTELRGLGDEARISRLLGPLDWRHRVAVAVRVRNVVIRVRAGVDKSAVHLRNRRHMPPIGRLEDGVLAAAREAVAVFTPGGASASPSAGTYRAGEARKPHGACGSAAARLLPGVQGRAMSPSGSGLGRGCVWKREHGDESDILSVNVEVVPPGPSGGQSATQAAAATARRWPAEDTPAAGHGLGADAWRHVTTGPGGLHEAEIFARRGNVLVDVHHRRRGGESVTSRSMAERLPSVVKKVLDGYP